MANHISHAALPYPVKGCRYTLELPYLDADGDPIDPSVLDTEISKDGGAYADCTEEISVITGSNGSGYITLTGDELNCSLAFVASKSGVSSPVIATPKTTLASLRPRVLPILHSGTAQAGAAGTITLAAGAPAYDVSGCIVRTTGGTGGGGGSGSLGNQARTITAYNTSTKVATVIPNWETTPGATTTYEVLITEVSKVLADLATLENIEDEVLDALTADHGTAGTIGKAITDTNAKAGQLTFTVANQIDGNVLGINGSSAAAIRLALSTGTALVPGTVTNAGFAPTTTEFEASDITTAAADHWNGRIIIFTSGTLLGQARAISDYALSSGRGHFTVAALTSAPANGVTFIIV